MATQYEKDQMVADFTAAQTAAQTGLDHANALVVVDTSALQAQVDTLTAQNSQLTADLATANDLATSLQAKLDAVKADRVAEESAEAQADAARAKIDTDVA